MLSGAVIDDVPCNGCAVADARGQHSEVLRDAVVACKGQLCAHA